MFTASVWRDHESGRSVRIGGLLRYGIPDFKLEKNVLDRRLDQLIAEGIEFKAGTHAGIDISAAEMRDRYDAILLAAGALQKRLIHLLV